MSEKNLKQKIERLVNFLQSGNYGFVIRESKILLKKIPNNTFLYNMIGTCYQHLNDLETAKRYFTYILQIDNKNTAALNNLGNVYKNLKNFELAEKVFKEALDLNPNFINAMVNLGSVNFELNKYEDAIMLYNKAISINSNVPMAHYNLGLVYQSLGKFEKSKFHFEELLKNNPTMTAADKIISRFTKYTYENEHIKSMVNKLDELKLTDIEKINLFFALGKAYEDLKDYKKSFYYLNKGNISKKKISKYNIEKDILFFQTLKEFFENINFSKGSGKASQKKILFIVGMPRSGTSLAEQILSSHSQVYGAGELSYLDDIVQKEFFDKSTMSTIKLKQLMDPDFLDKIASQYNHSINTFKSQENLITDKAPLNFRYIGLIKLIFPNSKIIHCSRSPKDNCLSLYKNLFDENLNFSYDQDDLSKFYKEYDDLMIFWNKNIPQFIHNIKYEKLISDPEDEIKNLLNFCGLGWEKDCLEFYKNKRAIKTVSSAQVRKSFYNSSVDSYKNYEIFLNNLNSSLDKF
jgi:tetratricopeptide (TPR) repeat protein